MNPKVKEPDLPLRSAELLKRLGLENDAALQTVRELDRIVHVATLVFRCDPTDQRLRLESLKRSLLELGYSLNSDSEPLRWPQDSHSSKANYFGRETTPEATIGNWGWAHNPEEDEPEEVFYRAKAHIKDGD